LKVEKERKFTEYGIRDVGFAFDEDFAVLPTIVKTWTSLIGWIISALYFSSNGIVSESLKTELCQLLLPKAPEEMGYTGQQLDLKRKATRTDRKLMYGGAVYDGMT
jgi:hypothetical protein